MAWSKCSKQHLKRTSVSSTLKLLFAFPSSLIVLLWGNVKASTLAIFLVVSAHICPEECSIKLCFVFLMICCSSFSKLVLFLSFWRCKTVTKGELKCMCVSVLSFSQRGLHHSASLTFGVLRVNAGQKTCRPDRCTSSDTHRTLSTASSTVCWSLLCRWSWPWSCVTCWGHSSACLYTHRSMWA